MKDAAIPLRIIPDDTNHVYFFVLHDRHVRKPLHYMAVGNKLTLRDSDRRALTDFRTIALLQRFNGYDEINSGGDPFENFCRS